MDNGEIFIYRTEDGLPAMDVKLAEGTIWLNQQQMALLFDKSKQNISLHIKDIFNEDELEKSSTVKEYLIVQNEGKKNVSRNIEYYSLDVIISVGYRVKSKEGTKFRIWANQILKDYLIKGYALNDKKNNLAKKNVWCRTLDSHLLHGRP